MKTVLNDELLGWFDFPDNQLLRCKDHKIIESKYMLNMPINSSFLDVGAHYGDTVLTMALHAKNNNRDDIRFYAFEPHPDKCNHIKNIIEINELNVKVFNHCVGDCTGKAGPDNCTKLHSNGVIIPSGVASYIKNTEGNIDIKKLDDYEQLITPVGFMHIDTEGWEASVLRGSHSILSNPLNKFHLIAEYWKDNVAKTQYQRGRAKGISTETPKEDIIEVLNNYSVKRLNDLHCLDWNLVFQVNM